MPIDVQCPKCQARMRVADNLAGRTGKCPKCQEKIVVPAANAPATAPQAKPAQPAVHPLPDVAPTPVENLPKGKPVARSQPTAATSPAPAVQPTAPLAPAAASAMSAWSNPVPAAAAGPNPYAFPQGSAMAVPTTAGASPSAASRRLAQSIQTWHRLWFWSLISSFLLVMLLVVGIVVGVVMLGISQAEAQANRATPTSRPRGEPIAPATSQVPAYVPLLISAGQMVTGLAGLANLVSFYVLLYKMWEVVQGGPARTTPGKAIGFLFIPLFNFYWMFVAIYGLAQDLNGFARKRNLSIRAASEGLTLAMCILTFVPCVSLVNIVMLPLALGSMAKAAIDIAKQT